MTDQTEPRAQQQGSQTPQPLQQQQQAGPAKPSQYVQLVRRSQPDADNGVTILGGVGE